MIHFNKPYLTGKETQNILKDVKSDKIIDNGNFTNRDNFLNNYA